MPRIQVDWSKTIIYKICSNDLKITDMYVGHTTDLRKRRSQHKTSCNNPNDNHYNYMVYNFIRNNGGWDCWSVVLVEEFKECKNSNQALAKERFWIEELKASLNKVKPTRTKKEYYEENKPFFDEYHSEYSKEYYKINKDAINQKSKEYYEKHNDKIVCECGKEILKKCLIRHTKTKLHEMLINDFKHQIS